MRAPYIAALAGGLCIGGIALAQVAFPPTDLNALNNIAASAVTQATPAPCPAPLPDALMATAGSSTPCMTRPDAQRATQVQATTVTTASDGTFSGTWPVPFAGIPVGRFADIELTAGVTTPYKCSFNAGSVTASAFAGKCYQLVATTLPTLTTALSGLVISPVANAAGNLTVRVIGRQ